MIDLKTVLREHPGCLSSRASFRSILMDIYPNEKRMVNILTSMLECGIVQKIKNRKILNNNEVQAILGQLENEYGIASIYASNGIKIWADAFSVSVQATSVQTTRSVIAPQPIVHAPIVETAVVEGAQSDYETIIENGCVTITKFIGFEEDELVIPNNIDGVSVKVIGNGAFEGCKGVKKIIISEGITEIHGSAFKNCTSLEDIALPLTLQEIGREAFEGCEKLKEIDLPNNIQVISDECFSGCRALKKVLLPDNLETIGKDSFCFAGLTEINIPASVKELKSRAFFGCEHLAQIFLHEGLSSIGCDVFEYCYALRSITIPKSVTAIDEDAFYGFHSDFTIFCYASSFALEYARKHGFQTQNAAKQ